MPRRNTDFPPVYRHLSQFLYLPVLWLLIIYCPHNDISQLPQHSWIHFHSYLCPIYLGILWPKPLPSVYLCYSRLFPVLYSSWRSLLVEMEAKAARRTSVFSTFPVHSAMRPHFPLIFLLLLVYLQKQFLLSLTSLIDSTPGSVWLS